MKIVQIDHKAAKKDCEYHLTAYPNEKNAVYNLRRSYLDLAAQLEATGNDRDVYRGQILYLREQLEAAHKESEEQARLLGMSAQREAKLLAQLEAARKEIELLRGAEGPEAWQANEILGKPGHYKP